MTTSEIRSDILATVAAVRDVITRGAQKPTEAQKVSERGVQANGILQGA
jgi:hypothetical protein